MANDYDMGIEPNDVDDRADDECHHGVSYSEVCEDCEDEADDDDE